jgi:hypothetical protein
MVLSGPRTVSQEAINPVELSASKISYQSSTTSTTAKVSPLLETSTIPEVVSPAYECFSANCVDIKKVP